MVAFSSSLFTVVLQFLSIIVLVGSSLASIETSGIPTVIVKNGTLNGRYIGCTWDQDVFLGIPFAQPPIGPLRFKWPQELNEPFPSPRDATTYGPSCMQYGSNFNVSEDCLTLNVIRPHGTRSTNSTAKLPVLVWIYGGGYFAGSTADPQYNLSGITPQILAEGSSNAALLDQRLALRWIKENIAAFGGDPERITIWGESAGAQSIGLHLHSYGGRDDGLFQSAILESGGPVGVALTPLVFYKSPVENITRFVGCYTAADQLTCLRELSSETLYSAQQAMSWNPIVDGDFLTDYPSVLAARGFSIKVPMLIGANSDEGLSFGVRGLDNETAIFNSLLSDLSWGTQEMPFPGLPYGISPPSARKLLELYPNDPINEPPYGLGSDAIFPADGLEWRRSAAIYGDIVMISGRRKLCEEYVDQPVYSYRFATLPFNAEPEDGVQHFVNVAFTFQNISGLLGPLPEYQSHKDLSIGIGKSYINFVNSHDPSGGVSTGFPLWPKWTKDNPVNLVLNASDVEVENDNFRAEGIAFLNSISRELFA